ncbi:MAG: GNAT family N-acetyltransferase, partial [Clostridia bacterium]|nr:GNAT family N-acetyltransferase [Clostridia bacterium]
TIETERLILRKFIEDDFAAVQSYAGCADNIIYMLWGPNSDEDTRAFINWAISRAEETPCTNFQYAAVLKTTNQLIGACNIAKACREAEIGWIVHRDYWKQGYGTEMGKALLGQGFAELNLHRITAHCDAENAASFRVMDKIGMRREGLFVEGRQAHKQSNKKYGDELSYAILKDEWEAQ